MCRISYLRLAEHENRADYHRMRALPALICCGLLGCAADRITGRPLEARVLSVHVWSGGTAHIRIASLPVGPPLPMAMVGVEIVQTTLEDDSTLAVPIPDTMGTLELRLEGAAPLPSLVVHGFEGYQESVPVDGYIHQWPAVGFPTAVALNSGHVARIDFRLGTASTFPLAGPSLTTDCLAAPTPSADDPAVVLTASVSQSGACNRLYAWDTRTGVSVDSGPVPWYYWPTIRLGPGKWLVSYKSYLVLFSLTANDTFLAGANIPCNKPTGFRISPNLRRVVPVACTPVSGPTPIFDVPSGAIVAHAPGAAASAAFSTTGDTLFVSVPNGIGSTLYAVASDDATVLATASIAANVQAIDVDASGRWLFAAAQDDTVPVVYVLDQQTLTPLATLRRPAATQIPSGEHRFNFMYWQILTSQSASELYLVFGGGVHPNTGVADTPTYRYRFSLVP